MKYLLAGTGPVSALAYAAFVCFALACAVHADPQPVTVRPAPALASGTVGQRSADDAGGAAGQGHGAFVLDSGLHQL